MLVRPSRNPLENHRTFESSLQLNVEESSLAHHVGLTGLPKVANPSVRGPKLPIKLFHTNPELGSLVGWIEELLSEGLISLPEVEVIDGRLGVVNECLDRLRSGKIGGKRLVVRVK